MSGQLELQAASRISGNRSNIQRRCNIPRGRQLKRTTEVEGGGQSFGICIQDKASTHRVLGLIYQEYDFNTVRGRFCLLQKKLTGE